MLGAVQPKINAELSNRVGESVVASLVNFAVAFCVVVVVVALRPATRRRIAEVRDWPVPRWTLTAGLGGAFVVLAGVLSVDTIGVAVFSVTFFSGQIAFGLFADRIGVSTGHARPFVAARIGAALLAVTAVAVAQIGRPVGRLPVGLLLVVIAAGGASAFQSGFNGRISRATGDGFAATAVNVAVGLTALVVAVGALAGAGALDRLTWPNELWLYAGGLLGVSIVLCLAIASGALGVLRATLAMLASQLVAAFVVDWVVADDLPTVGRLAGAALLVVAVLVVAREAVPLTSVRERRV